MIRRLFVLALLGALACGGSSSSPPAPAVPAAPAATPPTDDGQCLATFAKRKPEAGWAEAGKLVATVQDGQLTSIRAEDVNGTPIETRPAPTSSQGARQDMRELTCRLGGLVLLVAGREPPASGAGTVAFPVLKPLVADEKIDLAALCREPADMPPTPDAQKRYVIALESLDARLTTRKWRAWLWQLLEESEAAEGLAREELRAARADELRAAALKAGITPPCWYEEALRRRPIRQ